VEEQELDLGLIERGGDDSVQCIVRKTPAKSNNFKEA
jgi:hypothetical protein